MKELLAAFLHFIFPSPCRACGLPLDAARRSLICGRCWGHVRRIAEPFCPRCGKPFVSPVAPGSGPGHVCGGCRERPPAFVMARAATLYETGGTIRGAILLLKHGRRVSLARHLGRLMTEAADGLIDSRRFDLLIPVPLHARRERERGFNQAALLASELGSAWRLPVGHGLLQRARATEAQSGGREAREANVKGAFIVAQPDQVHGRSLLLIDDVLTSGATANECALALLMAGATEVGVYTLARVE